MKSPASTPTNSLSWALQSPGTTCKNLLWICAWVIFLGFATYHTYQIIQAAVNVPFSDEWNLVAPNGLIRGWSKNYILEFHNEHRIVFTKLLFLLNLKLFNLNFRYQIFLSLMLFWGVAFLFWKLVGAKIGNGRSLLALICFTVFLSNLNYLNHTMSFQICVRLMLLCFLGGTYLLFKQEGWFAFFCGLALWTATMFNFASGVSAVTAAASFYIAASLISKKSNYALKSMLTLTIIGAATWFWLHDFHPSPGYSNYTMPWNPIFIRFLGEITSLGFGFTELNILSAYLCLFILLTGLILALIATFRNGFQNDQTNLLIALTIGILAMFMLVDFGRANLSLLAAKGGAAYSEMGFFLPLLGLGLFNVYQPSYKTGGIAIAALVVIGICDNFNLSNYKIILLQRLEGIRCIEELSNNPNSNPKGICPTLYPHPIAGTLPTLNDLGIVFNHPLARSKK